MERMGNHRMKMVLNRIVVFVYLISHLMTYVVTSPVRAAEQEPLCGMQEHVHQEECFATETIPGEYVLYCNEAAIGAHSHDSSCLDENGQLFCGKADYYVHEHTSVCFDGDVLVCPLKYLQAHTHEESCYQQTQFLNCEEAHDHADTCYVLINETVCGKDEVILHTHEAACYDENEKLICTVPEVISHTHTESCLHAKTEKTLVCQIQEHQHSQQCYQKTADETQPSVPETTAPSIPETTASAVQQTVPNETVAETLPVMNTEPIADSFAFFGLGDDNIIESGEDNGILWMITQEEDACVLTVSCEGRMMDYGWNPEIGKYINSPWENYLNQITAIVIEEGITYIGENAFSYLGNVTNLELPNSLKEIGPNSFRGLGQSELTLPSGLEIIGDYAFEYSRITDLEIPDSVKFIGRGAFGESELSSLKLPNGPVKIGERAFTYNESLYDVTFPVECYFSLDVDAFWGTMLDEEYQRLGSATYYIDANGVWYMIAGDYAKVAICPVGKTAQTSLPAVGEYGPCTVRSDIVELGSCGDAQYYILNENDTYSLVISGQGDMCEYDYYERESYDEETDRYSWIYVTTAPWGNYRNNITSAVIEDGVTSIGEYAFSGMTAMKSMTIGAGVSVIGDNAFNSCSELRDVTVSATNTSLCYDNGVFYSGDKSRLLTGFSFVTSVTIPATVTVIEENALFEARNLKEVHFSGEYISIESKAFCNSYNSSIEVLDFKNTYIRIAEDANFCSVKDPSMQELNGGFYYVTEDGIWYSIINDKAYMNMCPENVVPSLTQTPKLGSHGPYPVDTSSDIIDFGMTGELSWFISGEGENCTLYLTGDGRTKDYEFEYDYIYDNGEEERIEYLNVPWHPYIKDIVNVQIGDGVTYIGSYAFSEYPVLKSVKLGAGFEEFGYSVFRNTSDVEITVSDENPLYCAMDGMLFSKNKEELILGFKTDVQIPSTTKKIAVEAFVNKVNSATVDSACIFIERWAFDAGLTEFNATNSYLHISDRAFGYSESEFVANELQGSFAYVDSNGVWYNIIDNTAFVHFCPDGVEPLAQTPKMGEFGPYPVNASDGFVAGGEASDLSWYILEEEGAQTLYIVGQGEMDSYDRVEDEVYNEETEDYEWIYYSGAPWGKYYKTIEHVVIGNEVTLITDDAVYAMSKLKTLFIGRSVSSIHSSLFSRLRDETEIIFHEDNHNFCTIDGLIFNKDITQLLHVPDSVTSLTIPQTVKTLSYNKVSYNTNLTDITFEGDYIQLDDSALEGCSSLSGFNTDGMYVDLPEYSPFYDSGMSYLEGLRGGLYYVNKDGVWFTIFEGKAYPAYCPENVTITQEETEQLGKYGPYPIDAQTNIVVFGNTGRVSWYITGTEENYTLYITGSGNMSNYDLDYYEKYDSEIDDWVYVYESDAPWRNYPVKNVVVEDGVTNIGNYAFYDMDTIENFSIGKDVRTFTTKSIQACDAVSGLVVSSDNPYIVFDGSIVYNADQTAIIYVLPNLSRIDIPETITLIDQNVFSDNAGLEIVTLYAEDIHLKEGAFSGCTSLKKVHIYESYVTLEENVFAGCSQLAPLDSVQAGMYYVDQYGNWYAILDDTAYLLVDTGNPILKELPYFNGKGPYPVDNLDVTMLGTTGDVFWILSGEPGNYTLTINGNGKMADYDYSSSSNEYNDLTPWHKYSSEITEVNIEYGVTNVGEYAFYNCSALESAFITGSVDTVGKYAFASCRSLTEVTLSDGVKKLEGSAFQNCSALVDLDIPEGYIEFGENVVSKYDWEIERKNYYYYGPFEGCSSLPAFYSNKKAQTFYFDDYGAVYSVIDGIAYTSCMPIGDSEYEWEEYIPKERAEEGYYPVQIVIDAGVSGDGFWKIVEQDGIKTLVIFGNGKMADYIAVQDYRYYEGERYYYTCGSTAPWDSYRGEIDRLVIEEGITNVGNYAFWGTKFADFELPSTVSTIGEYAFSNNSGITEIKLTDSITSMGMSAFESCSRLETVEIPESIHDLPSYAFRNCSALKNVTLSEGIESIGDYAFYSCDEIENLHLPDSVTEIGSYAFYYCASLKTINLPDGIKEIKRYTFYSAGFEEISLPEGLETIAQYAFYASDLKHIVFPEGLKKLQSNAFYYCQNLESVTFQEGWIDIEANVFRSCPKLDGLKELLEGHYVDENGVIYYVIDGVAYVQYQPEGAPIPEYIDGENGESDKYPVGGKGFYASGKAGENVTYLVTKEGNDYIATLSGTGPMYDWSSYYNTCWYDDGLCSIITKVVIEDGVTRIGDNAFNSLESLVSVSIPESVTSIGNRAFEDTYDLNTIYLNAKNLETVGNNIFDTSSYYQPNKIILGTSVDSVNDKILNNLSNTELSIEVPNVITFNEAIPSGIKVGKYAGILEEAGTYYFTEDGSVYRLEDNEATLLYIADGIGEFTVPASVTDESGKSYPVTNIHKGMLRDASALTDLTFEAPENIRKIEDFQFSRATSLERINGLSSESEIKKLFINAEYGFMPFVDTQIQMEFTPSQEPVVVMPADSQMSASLSVKNISGYDKLTGEYITTEVTFSDNTTVGYTPRVYVRFSGDGQFPDRQIGLTPYETSTGKRFFVNLSYDEDTNIYCLEMIDATPGEILTFNFNTLYPCPDAAAGSAIIWGEIYDSNEDKTVRSSTYQFLTWSTIETTVNNSVYANGTTKLYGDGTENGPSSAHGVSFAIDTTEVYPAASNYGKNCLYGMTFENSITLPEGMHWNPQIVEAVNAGEYTTDYLGAKCTVDGVSQTIVTAEYERYNNYYDDLVPHVKFVDDALVVSFTYQSNANGEQNIPKVRFTLGGNLIYTDTSRPPVGTTYAISNEVETVALYKHCKKAGPGGSATVRVTSTKAEFNADRYIDEYFVNYGLREEFDIVISNYGTQHFSNLARVTDKLNVNFMLTPKTMETMFADAYGKYLTISITDMSVHRNDHLESLSDGYSLGNTSYSCVYHGIEQEADGCLLAESVDVEIGWNDSGDLMVTVAEYNDNSRSVVPAQQYVVGDSLYSLFESIGLLTDSDTVYTVEWDFGEGIDIYSGMSMNINLDPNVKDSFMYLNQDSTGYRADSHITDTVVLEYEDKAQTSGLRTKTLNYNYINFGDWTGAYCVYRETNGNIVSDEIMKTGGIYGLDLGLETANCLPATQPVIVRLQGAQSLLVPVVSKNAHLSDLGLSTVMSGSTEYYLLDEIGVYENVYLGGYVAESVTVSQYAYDASTGNETLEQGSENYLDTMIRWKNASFYYESDIRRCSNDLFLFFYPVNEISDTMMFRVNAEIWEGDHQGRRLYASDSLSHTFLSTENAIVTERGASPEEDATVRYLPVHEGETILYRPVLMCNLDEAAAQANKPLTANGSVIYNILPKIPGTWTKDDISIEYVYDSTVVTLENKDAWEIVDGKIVWSEDFKMTFTKESNVYFYISVKNPDGESWQSYLNAYGSVELEDVFVLFQQKGDKTDKVYHALSEQADAQLVIGVESTGVHKDIWSNVCVNTNVESRLIYENSTLYKGFVQYYVTIVNDGRTRLYLDNLQLILPEGFSMDRIQSSYASRIVDDDGESIVKKSVPYGKLSYHSQVNNAGNTVYLLDYIYSEYVYDEDYFMHPADDYLPDGYLLPNETLSFVFYAYPGSQSETLDMSTCKAALGLWDYNDGGFGLDQGTVMGSDRGAITLNDGESELVDTHTATGIYGFMDEGNVSQWLTSSVSVVRGSAIPGMQKTVEKIDYPSIPGESSYAQDTATVTWKLKAVNEGSNTLEGYTITDIMQQQYDFVGNVYLQIEYGDHLSNAASLTQNIYLFNAALLPGEGQTSVFSTNVGQIQVSNERCMNDGVQSSRLSVHFEDSKAAIPAGGSCSLIVSTKNVGTYKNKTYVNVGYLTPDSEKWNDSMVTTGELTELDGERSIQSDAQVTVTSHFATAASKSVSEIGNVTNSATSKYRADAIVLRTEDKKLTYTLEVVTYDASEQIDSEINKLVFIDNLPSEEDAYVFTPDVPRNSDFKVSLQEDSNFRVVMISDGVSRTLSADEYIIQYNDGSDMDYTEADWKGEPAEKWTSDPEGARAFRIIISEADTGVCVPMNTTIRVTFDAFIDDTDLAFGNEAWNSFGYFYAVESTSSVTREMTAEPMKVGVKIPSTPAIVVNLEDPQGESFCAEQQERFSYLILKSVDHSLVNLESVEDIAAAVQGKEFTIATLDVPEGAAASLVMVLEHLNEYSFDASSGEWVETQTPWLWGNGQTYTFVQLPIENSEDYAFKSIGGNSINSFIYTYDESKQVTIPVVNDRKIWNIEVKTVDKDTGAVLPGAWYAIYTLIEGEKFDGSVPSDINATVADMLVHDGVTYYLYDFQKSDDQGIVTWKDLKEASYLLKEVQTPAGYNYNNELYSLVQPEDVYNNTVHLIVQNRTGFTLPESGGAGKQDVLLTGVVMTTLAIVALAMQLLQKKRKRNY